MLALPAPMKAVAGPLPEDEDGWAYEIKWDGMRVMAGVEDGHLRATSTRGLDLVPRFPELDGLADQLDGHEVVLDGEMVAFAGNRTDFARMQQRMHVATRHEAERRMGDNPVCFVIFDLLRFDGLDTVDLPYVDRRRLLCDLIEPGPGWQVPAHRVGDGAALFEVARATGLEGLMAKRLASTYQPGRRSPSWRKVKVRHRQELVVGGWTPGEGGRSRAFGALLLGHHQAAGDGGPLVFAGAVGTGFDQAEIDRLVDLFARTAAPTSPFDGPLPPTARGARWLRPELVVEVEFGEWTPEGRLRHPAYVGQRIDADPAAVVREPSSWPHVSESTSDGRRGGAHDDD